MKSYDTYYSTHNNLMSTKSKQILKTNKSPTSMNSFNSPKPFQEPLGGFIWPPRSYTCGFCKRKFRSAQALGGHMNVHRRDRAKLKQSTSPQKQSTSHLHRHSSSYQQTDRFNDRNYAFPGEYASSNRSFQDQSLVSTSTDKKMVEPFFKSKEILPGLKSRNTVSRAAGFEETKLSVGKYLVDTSGKDGKRCKKNDRYSGCSSMEDIDLELRLGNPPTACELQLSSLGLRKF